MLCDISCPDTFAQGTNAESLRTFVVLINVHLMEARPLNSLCPQGIYTSLSAGAVIRELQSCPIAQHLLQFMVIHQLPLLLKSVSHFD
jgi:hypothetical protein